MKKLCMIFAILSLFVFVSCGDSKKENKDETTDSSDTVNDEDSDAADTANSETQIICGLHLLCSLLKLTALGQWNLIPGV